MKTIVIIIGTALAVGFLFTAWLLHSASLEYGYVTGINNILLFLSGVMVASGISVVIIGREL
tara:strand:+ start:36 stop:221 length:186 start_codon:yes stop_codon:yes gene_type:complete